MKINSKKVYIKPDFKNYGSFAHITQQGGGQGIDGIIGIDINGDGNVDSITINIGSI